MTDVGREDTNQVVTVDRAAPRAPLTWTTPVGLLSVSLGGVVFRHVSQEPAVGLTLSNRFAMFRVSDTSEADCTVSWSTGAVTPGDGEVLQSTEIWEARRASDGAERTVFFSGRAKRPYMSLTFYPGFRRAEIVQAAGSLESAFSPELHPLSEYLTSRVLSWTGRVEVHASAAVISRRALLFVGHSGAGKTTISQIAERAGAAVLSDDRVILGMRGGQPTAWGTPWHGSGWFTSSESCELGAVFLLRQGTSTYVTPLSHSDTIKHLFVRSIQARVRADEVLASHAVLEAVLAAVPAFEFTFEPTVSAFRIAQRAMQAQASA